MKTKHLRILTRLCLTLWATAQAADYTYETNNGTITITGYTGPGGAVIIPDTINGLSVTSIWGGEPGAFQGSSLTSVRIPDSVNSIGIRAFSGCASLTAITVDASNSFYSSVDGVLFDKGQTTLIQYPAGRVGSDYTIPDSVTNFGDSAFALCTNLTSVTIPNSVTSIGRFTFGGCTSLTNVIIGKGVTTIDYFAFVGCTSLTGVYFQGNAPSLLSGFIVFDNTSDAVVYYLPGTTGWDTTYSGRPTAQWWLPNPLILTTAPNFGIQTNQFGFVISWATNLSVVVEASTTLTNPTWSPVATNILTSGSSSFSDPQWTEYPTRFYRIRSP